MAAWCKRFIPRHVSGLDYSFELLFSSKLSLSMVTVFMTVFLAAWGRVMRFSCLAAKSFGAAFVDVFPFLVAVIFAFLQEGLTTPAADLACLC